MKFSIPCSMISTYYNIQVGFVTQWVKNQKDKSVIS